MTTLEKQQIVISTPHLKYHPTDNRHHLRSKMYETLEGLIDEAALLSEIEPQDFHVLEVGPGRGELMRRLAEKGFSVAGVDIDPSCVEMSRRYGPCEIGEASDLLDCFGPKSFDLIVMSHVLEHLPEPLNAINSLKQVSRKWLLLAVPNPVTPLTLYKNMRGQLWSNPTHMMLWDNSHFHHFLTRHAGLEIVQEDVDYVEIFIGRLRSMLSSAGVLPLASKLETGPMPAAFPWLSESIIKLCRVD